MYKSLYRKYRPSRFEDMYGQEHIRTVLVRQCETGQVSHAYLFCGTRGTGKTTSAKILAKAVNCENPVHGEPCGKCRSCLAIDAGTATDVLEIDAASNNGVDNIRDICEEIVYPPTELKKRVYIIDEVHMLSPGAYNALLKTLEEPPEYVIFILATTELQKIPPTILSRCQRFEFRRIPISEISACLLSVASKEGFTLESDAADMLSRLADGSMRDALSLLESCVSAAEGGDVTAETVSRQLGLAGDDTVAGMFRAVAAQNASECLALLDDYYDSAKSMSLLVENMIAAVRDILVFSQPGMKLDCASPLSADDIKDLSSRITAADLLSIAEVLEDTQTRLVRYPFNKRLLCEMTLVRLCDRRLSTSPQGMLARITALETGIRTAVPAPAPAKAEAPKKREFPKPSAPVQTAAEPYDKFAELADRFSANRMLYTVISQSKVIKSGKHIIFRTSPFGIDTLGDPDALAALKAAFKALDGEDYDISFEDESASPDDPGLIKEL